MQTEEAEIVNQSYKRCLESPSFMSDFYEVFMAKDGHIREKFSHTDMSHQMRALRDGIQYMIMFAAGSHIAEAKVEDLALHHDRDHRNIAPALYEIWVQSLLETLQKHDPLYSEELALHWRNVLAHGILRMQAKF